jgi:hypothetical protein
MIGALAPGVTAYAPDGLQIQSSGTSRSADRLASLISTAYAKMGFCIHVDR